MVAEKTLGSDKLLQWP